MTQITNEIFQVGGGGFTAHEDAAIYLISFDGHTALVDGGCGRSHDKLLANIRSCGTDPAQIEYLLLTHCHFDHTGGAKALKEELGCQVVSHELDAPYLEQGNSLVTAANWYGSHIQAVTVDRKISGPGEGIQLGDRSIRAIHIPGHSPGSMVYITESEGLKVLFGQDVHGPLDPSFLSDKGDYLKSLDRLISLEADILCEGHFGIYRGKNEVEGFIRSFLTSA